MSLVAGYHFRNDDAWERFEIFRRVQSVAQPIVPVVDFVTVDSLHDPYNRAASRNLFMEKALEANIAVAIIMDADSIPEREPLLQAIEIAYHEDKIVIPFNQVKVLPRNTFLTKPHAYERLKPLYEYGKSFGGIYVCRPSVWVEAGGMDERIIGWGFEDQIILSAAKTFLGGPVFVPGVLYNINHQRSRDSLHEDRNIALVHRYHEAEGNPVEFRKIQAGSNRWYS